MRNVHIGHVHKVAVLRPQRKKSLSQWDTGVAQMFADVLSGRCVLATTYAEVPLHEAFPDAEVEEGRKLF